MIEAIGVDLSNSVETGLLNVPSTDPAIYVLLQSHVP